MSRAPATDGLAKEVSTDSRRRLAATVSRGSIAAAAAVAVLWQGGVDLPAVWALWGLAVLAWLASLPHHATRPHRHGFAGLWLGLGTYSLAHLLPLPRSVVGVLHPSAVAISDAGRAALGLQPLELLPIAIAPADAAFQIVVYLVCATLAMLYGYGLMRPQGKGVAKHDGTLLGFLMVAAAVLWGLSWGRWMMKLVPVGLRDTLREIALVNPNHLAGLCAIGVAFAFREVVRVENVARRNFYLTMGAGLGGVALLTGSRGGVLACALVTVYSWGTKKQTWRFQRTQNTEAARRRRIEAGLQVLTALLVVAMFSVPFIEDELLPTLIRGRGEGKSAMLRRAARHLGEGWLFGQGSGSLPVTSGIAELVPGKRLDFAENLVLQRLYDVGLWGTLPFFAGLTWLLSWQWVRLKRAAIAYGPWLAVAGVVVQNLADFSLEIAGGLLPVLLAGTQTERLLTSKSSRFQLPMRWYRPVVLSASGLALLASGALLAQHGQATNRHAREAMLAAGSLEALTAERYTHHYFAFYTLCRERVTRGDFKGALPLCDRAVALRPDEPTLRLVRFATALDAGRDTTLKADLRTLLRDKGKLRERALAMCLNKPKGMATMLELAPQLHEQAWDIAGLLAKERPDALEAFVLALRKERGERPLSAEYLLGRAYLEAGETRAADRIATRLIAHGPTQPLGWSLQAELLLRAGRAKDALVLFDHLCRDYDGRRGACVRALVASQAAQSPAEALTYAQSVFVLLRGSRSQAYFWWLHVARLHMTLKHYEKAISAAHRALGLQRNSPEALALEARAYLAISDWQAAERAVRLMPTAGRWGATRVELAEEVTRSRKGRY